MIDKKQIAERSKKLEEAKHYLKTQFIGIDNVIDNFINSVKIWYILSEIQSRPLIVNLWGITGVGKTDLVRKFINFIEFTDRFVEVQLDSKDGETSIEDYLENAIENHDDQGVLLLDEMQRFRTINNDGMDNNSNKFQDIWMLLSDGTFQSDHTLKQELLDIILSEDYWDDRNKHHNDEEEEEETTKTTSGKNKGKKDIKNFKNTLKKAVKPKIEYKYGLSSWEAKRIKKLLKLKNPLSEIMAMSRDEKLALIKEKLASKETFEGKKYSKLLVIISGNLDEAFHMANKVEDADHDANVYHEYSKTIDIISIKRALKARFKPEQIARFGNIHIIYPTLSRSAYQGIIAQRIGNILGEVHKKHSIEIKADQSIHDVIYNNGVFPTQGVRPLLSTVSSILENSLPVFLFEYLNGDERKPIVLTHDNGFITSKINKKVITYAIPRVLDDIKKKQTINDKTLIAVHEAGHSVVYANQFKAVPTQIVANMNSNDGGFMGWHQCSNTKTDYINRIMVLFGGRIAEELVFGKELVTSGALSDYQMATQHASNMIRQFGFYGHNGVYNTEKINEGEAFVNVGNTDEHIKRILDTLYAHTVKLMKENYEFLIEVTDALIDNDKLSTTDFKEIAEGYVPNIMIVDPADSVENEFNAQYKAFKEKEFEKQLFSKP